MTEETRRGRNTLFVTVGSVLLLIGLLAGVVELVQRLRSASAERRLSAVLRDFTLKAQFRADDQGKLQPESDRARATLTAQLMQGGTGNPQCRRWELIFVDSPVNSFSVRGIALVEFWSQRRSLRLRHSIYVSWPANPQLEPLRQLFQTILQEYHLEASFKAETIVFQ